MVLGYVINTCLGKDMSCQHAFVCFVAVIRLGPIENDSLVCQ